LPNDTFCTTKNKMKQRAVGTRSSQSRERERVSGMFLDHGFDIYNGATDYMMQNSLTGGKIDLSGNVGTYKLTFPDGTILDITSENIVFLTIGDVSHPGTVIAHDESDTIMFRTMDEETIYTNPSEAMFSISRLMPVKNDFYYGNSLFEDMEELVEQMVRENDQLYGLVSQIESPGVYDFSTVTKDPGLTIPFRFEAFNDAEEGFGTPVRAEFTVPFFEGEECREHLKGKFLDNIFGMVYRYSLGRTRHYTQANAIAFSIRYFMDLQYDRLGEVYPPRDMNDIFNVYPTRGGTSLAETVDAYVYFLNLGTTVEAIPGILQFYQLMKSQLDNIQNMVNLGVRQQLATQFLKQINDNLSYNTPDFDLSEEYGTGSLIMSRSLRTVRQKNMQTRDPVTNYENRLSMVLEPRHDFMKERVKGFNIEKTIERITEDYIKSHSSKFDIISRGDFEKKNYIEYSTAFDNPRHLQSFGYEKRLTLEGKKGDFYKAVRWLVEQFISKRPLVRDAKGTVFLKKLFDITKENKTMEVTVDGASGSLKIESSGKIAVDYGRDLFKLPSITPSGVNPDLITGSRAVNTMNKTAKVAFGIKRKKKVVANDWVPGLEYKKDDTVYINIRNDTIDKITVANLSEKIKAYSTDKSLSPAQRDIGIWTCLNMKRVGDQGQVLFAKEIFGVFETLDFLAAAFASIKGVDYVVNSDQQRNLYVKIKRELSYREFKTELIAWAVRTGSQTNYAALGSIIPNMIEFLETAIPTEGERMDYMALVREMIGIGSVLNKSLNDAYKGKLKEYIGRFFEEFINNLSRSVVEGIPLEKAVDKLETYTDSQLKILFTRQALTTFCKTNFAVFSRLNSAMRFLKGGVERLQQTLQDSIPEELFRICYKPISDFVDQIFPGAGDIVTRLMTGKELLLRLVENMRGRILYADVDPEKMIYVYEFFEFFDLYIEIFKQ